MKKVISKLKDIRRSAKGYVALEYTGMKARSARNAEGMSRAFLRTNADDAAIRGMVKHGGEARGLQAQLKRMSEKKDGAPRRLAVIGRAMEINKKKKILR